MELEQQILNWNPKFKIYQYKEVGVLLISEREYFFLQESMFPAITQFDGKESNSEIMAWIKDISSSALFLYKVKQLCHQNLLVEVSSDTRSRYICNKSETNNINCQIKNSEIISLSSIDTLYLDVWYTVLSTNSKFKNLNTTFVLVDDFLDKRIASVIKDLESYCLIKVTGERIWISPISTVSAPLYWHELVQQLWRNQPVRKYVEELYPDEDHSLPYLLDAVLTKENIEHIKSLIQQQLNTDIQEVLILDLADNHIEKHPVNPHYADELDFKAQINTPIKLQSCPSLYNKDGGSRKLDPAETLANLAPLISPVSGVITHIEEIDAAKNHTVKIYRTAFFKTPPLRQDKTLPNESFVQVCMGKGVSPTQSKVSALCEAIERYAAVFQGCEPYITCKQSELVEKSVSYQQLVPYSCAQYANFANPDHPDSKFKQAAIPYTDEKISWVQTWSLTHEKAVYAPLSECFSNIPFEDDRFGRWHSNGCAAGNTIEEAILQALFELIERDATAIWWYNQTNRPEFDLNRLSADNLKDLNDTLSLTHKYWVLDLTTDIGIPVMVAIGQDHNNGGYILGLGCHLQPELAAQRALTELCQLIPIRDQNGAPFDFNAIVEGEYLHPNSSINAFESFIEPSGDIKDDIKNIVKKLDELGFETLALNYSRAHIPINAAKIFVPGLCHIWPQFANERLYQIPLSLGWLKEAKTETTINQQDLYI